MKMLKKSILIFGAVVFLVFAGSLASAVTDSTGDVYHGTMTNGSWSYVTYSGERANIDISSVDYSVSGSNVTVTLTVSGSIPSSENIFYHIYLVGSEGNYSVLYGNGYTTWFGYNGYLGEGGAITDPTVSGNILTVTFSPAHPSDSFSVYGFSWEVVSADETNAEWYLDYAPDAYAPWYTASDDDDDDNPPVDDDDDNPPADDDDDGTDGTQGDDDDEDKGIPGFEIVTLIAAIAVALIILRRKK